VELAIIHALLVLEVVQAIVKPVIPLLDNYLLANVRVKLDTMIMVAVKPVLLLMLFANNVRLPLLTALLAILVGINLVLLV